MADITFRVTVTGAQESAQQIDNVRKSLQGVDAELTNASTATKTFGTSQDNLAASTKVVATEVVALTGGGGGGGGALNNWTKQVDDAYKANKDAAASVSDLGDEFKKAKSPIDLFALGLTAASIAGDIFVAVVTSMVLQGRAFVEAQNAANAAVASMDFSASLSGLQAANRAIADYTANWTRFVDEFTNNDKATSFAGFWAGIASGVSAGIQTLKGGITGLTVTQEQWAQSTQANFDLIEKGRLSLAALTAQTAEQKAQLSLAKDVAASYPDLSQIYDKEAASIKALADERANQQIREALALDQMLRRAGQIEQADQTMALTAAKANAERGAAYAAADAVILEGQKKIAEGHAKEILDAAKLIDIQNQIAIAAASTGASREQIIEQTSALELKRITDTYNAHKAANDAILASLPYGGVAWQDAYRKGLVLDEQFNLDRLKGAQKTADEWIKIEMQRFEEEKKLYAKAKDLDEAKFQLRKVLGEVSAQEEVDRLRKQADAYEANTIERVNAEIKWATAAKKLRVEVSADDGKALEKAREQYGLYADDIIKFGLTAGPAAVAADNDITGALNEMIIKGREATEVQDKLGQELSDLGVGIVEGLKKVRTDSVTEVEGLITDITKVIDTGASRIGDRVYQGLIDRLKATIDAEALAS